MSTEPSARLRSLRSAIDTSSLPPVAGGDFPDETIEETSDNLEQAEQHLEGAKEAIDQGDKEEARSELDLLKEELAAAKAEIAELRALTEGARADLDSHTTQHPDGMDSHPVLSELERDLGEWDNREHAPEETHHRYRKVFG